MRELKRSEWWKVELMCDGARVFVTVKVEPPFSIRCAQAEVQAIKMARALDPTLRDVRALSSQFVEYA